MIRHSLGNRFELLIATTSNNNSSQILETSHEFLDDQVNEFGTCTEDHYMDKPPEKGLWVLVCKLSTHHDPHFPENDHCRFKTIEWRRPTDAELERFNKGEPVFLIT